MKAIEEYLASPAPGTVLALVAEELKKDAALTKACAKIGDVLAYDVAKRKADAWVAERFKQAGVRAQPDAVAALVQLVGEDFHQLANEVDKLALWAGDEPIGEHEVEQLVAAVAETPTFALTDAWAQRDAGRTLEASETIFEREGRPRRDTAPRLAGALGNHLAFMRRCQRLAAEGIRARDAASTLKRHPFYVEKVFGQAANFTEDELRTRGRPPRRARPRAQGRQQACARPRAPASPDRPQRRDLGGERRRRRAGRRATSYGAAVFLCSAPCDAALSIHRISSRCSAATLSVSPSATAASSRFVSVFTVER